VIYVFKANETYDVDSIICDPGGRLSYLACSSDSKASDFNKPQSNRRTRKQYSTLWRVGLRSALYRFSSLG
jgi:hypothetical protein